jgi:hypothetical protein
MLREPFMRKDTGHRRLCIAVAATLAMSVARTAIVHTVAAAGLSSDLVSSTFEGSSSFTLSNGTLELTFLPRGANIASVVLIDDSEKMNPLWTLCV